MLGEAEPVTKISHVSVAQNQNQGQRRTVQRSTIVGRRSIVVVQEIHRAVHNGEWTIVERIEVGIAAEHGFVFDGHDAGWTGLGGRGKTQNK